MRKGPPAVGGLHDQVSEVAAKGSWYRETLDLVIRACTRRKEVAQWFHVGSLYSGAGC